MHGRRNGALKSNELRGLDTAGILLNGITPGGIDDRAGVHFGRITGEK